MVGDSNRGLGEHRLAMFHATAFFTVTFSNLAFASMQPQPLGADVMEPGIRAVMEMSLVDPTTSVGLADEVAVLVDT